MHLNLSVVISTLLVCMIFWNQHPYLYRNNEDSFVDNLMLGVQLADVSTRCSSHPQGKSEARCEIDGNL